MKYKIEISTHELVEHQDQFAVIIDGIRYPTDGSFFSTNKTSYERGIEQAKEMHKFVS